MKVYVKLFASLVRNVSEAVRRQQPREIKAGYPLEIELPEESTLADLVAYLSLDRKLVAASLSSTATSVPCPACSRTSIIPWSTETG